MCHRDFPTQLLSIDEKMNMNAQIDIPTKNNALQPKAMGLVVGFT